MPEEKKERKTHLRRTPLSTRSSSESESDESLRCRNMAGELAERFKGRSKFPHYRRRHFEESASLLSKKWFDSWKVLSKIDEAIKFLREDIRKGVHRRSNLASPTRPSRA